MHCKPTTVYRAWWALWPGWTTSHVCMQETIGDAKHVRSSRGKLFLFLSTFFLVEGLGILASPNLAQRVSHLPLQLFLTIHPMEELHQVSNSRVQRARGIVFYSVGLLLRGGPGHPVIGPPCAEGELPESTLRPSLQKAPFCLL